MIMNEFKLPYGSGHLTVEFPDKYQVDLIAPTNAPAALDPSGAVVSALQSPLGVDILALLSRSTSAAICVNDKTRPVPHQHLLPPLLNLVEAGGISPEKTSLLIATGTHTPMQPDEFTRILPADILANYPVFSHDFDAPDLVDLGQTSRGTPILINRRFMQADLRIVIGNIEPHHFMGFSGGVKSGAIGLAGRATIIQNHSMLSHPLAKAGHYTDNPMRQDIEEIGDLAGIHLALNAILNNDKEISTVLFGHPATVMQVGVPLARQVCQVRIKHLYDLVIASAGGYPKDINLYQSQKALTHAAMMTRDGGTILLLAECIEGVGSPTYEKFMEGLTNFDQVFERFRLQGFQVGPHKAFQIARDASRIHILLYSKMDAGKTRSLLLSPVNNLENTLSGLLNELKPGSHIAVMPIGPITIPVLDFPQ